MNATKAKRLQTEKTHRRRHERIFVLGSLLCLGLLAGCGLFGQEAATNAPTVQILRPGDQAVVGGANVVIRVTATPRGIEDNFVSFVNVTVNGTTLGEATLVEGSDPPIFAITWNSTEVADGTYRVEAIAFDKFQARGLSAPVNVVVKNQSTAEGPAVDILSPRDGDLVSGTERIIVQALPGEPALTQVDFLVDGAVLSSVTEAPFQFDWDTEQETAGDHMVSVRAYSAPDAFKFSVPLLVHVVRADDGGQNGGGEASTAFKASGYTGNVKGSVAVGFNNDLYIGTLSDTLYAFTPSGRLRWKAATMGPIRSSPVVGNNEDVFVTSEDGRLYGFTSTGSQLWPPYNTHAIVRSTPAFGVEGALFFGDSEGRVHAVNSINGLTLDGWPVQVTDGASIVVSPVIARDRTVIVAGADGKVYALGPDGEKRWESIENVGSVSVGMALVERTFEIRLPNGDVTTTDANVIYIVSNNGFLYAMSGQDGTILWSEPLTGPFRSGPVVGPDGAIYVGTSTGLIVFNEETNASTPRLRFIHRAEDVGTPVLDANENVYFVAGKRLRAINPNNTPLWEFDINAQTDGPLTLGRDGLIYFASNNGVMLGVDTGSVGLAQGKWPMFQRNARHSGRLGIDADDG